MNKQIQQVVGYRMNTHKSVILLYINNEQIFKNQENNFIYNNMKNKILWINITAEVKDHTLKTKTIDERKKDPINGKISYMPQEDFVDTLILPIVIYRFNSISVK